MAGSFLFGEMWFAAVVLVCESPGGKKKTVFFVPLKSLPYHSGDKHKVLQFSTLLRPEFYDVYRVELSALEHPLL